jgi:hypothetical protein
MDLQLRWDRYSVSAAQAICMPSACFDCVEAEDARPIPEVEHPSAYVVEDNIVKGIPGFACGPIVLTMGDCVVMSKDTGTVRRIPAVTVQGEMASHEPHGEDGYIDLAGYAFLRVMVQDAEGRLAMGTPHVGLALCGVTLEGPVNADGYADFFLPMGPCTVYLLESRGHDDEAAPAQTCAPVRRQREDVTIVIDGRVHEDAGTVVLVAR